MKKLLLITPLAIIAICILSQNSFSQTAPGGSGNGASQPCPTSFKRNNGNGTCGGKAEIRVSFDQAPSVAPLITAIWYNGKQITNIALPINGDISTLTNKGYISYCLSGSNIPPAKKLKLEFNYSIPQNNCTLTE